MAARLNVMCADGAFFIHFAQTLSDGHSAAQADNYDLNVYPVVLAMLHRMGLDWETGAKFWGVACASLVVLPLFGWMRRAFDDRIATVGCALYAVHPKLIEWSPEVVRESTFWLFFMLTIYALFRAMTEIKPSFFYLSGVACGLAINTRFEGWFLFLLVGCWGVRRLMALREARGRLVSGIAIHALCLPLVLVALMMAHGHSQWHWGSFHRLKMVFHWVDSLDKSPVDEKTAPAANQPIAAPPEDAAPQSTPTEASPAPQAAAIPAPALHGEELMTTRELLWLFVHTLERGFTPLFGLLMLFGHVVAWRVWVRSDVQPLFLWSVATLAGMWVHMWTAQETSSRYAMAMVLLAMPFAAAGLLRLSEFAARAYQWQTVREPTLFRRRCLTLIIFSVPGVVGLVDALSSQYHGRWARAELGEWVRQEYGPGNLIVGSNRWKILNYYAQGRYLEVVPASRLDPRRELELQVETNHPDLVVVYPRDLRSHDIPPLLEHLSALGLKQVGAAQLPSSCRHQVIVLTRREPKPRLARPAPRHSFPPVKARCAGERTPSALAAMRGKRKHEAQARNLGCPTKSRWRQRANRSRLPC